jgi:hypothetical protein
MERLWSQLTPHREAGEIASVAVDTVRRRRELVIENTVLRHQVNVLHRRSKRQKLHVIDRPKLLVAGHGPLRLVDHEAAKRNRSTQTSHF